MLNFEREGKGNKVFLLHLYTVKRQKYFACLKVLKLTLRLNGYNVRYLMSGRHNRILFTGLLLVMINLITRNGRIYGLRVRFVLIGTSIIKVKTKIDQLNTTKF